MDKAIETSELTHWYGRLRDTPAVVGINLAVAPGQLYGLVGPDGAGKTTILRLLSSVISVRAGSAQVAGFDVRRDPEAVRRSIGYMPQIFSLYADLTVIENLSFYAEIHHVPRARKAERIGEMLAFSRLERFRQRRAGQLSGGMKKKLALACALVHDPRVLLLDEPSTGVDPASRRELWQILAQVAAQGVAVLVSTPYMDEAERCHQVGMLYQGELMTTGAPQTLTEGLPFDIIEVKAKPRKAMREVVARTDGIRQWRPVGDRLRLSVRRENGQVRRVLSAIETGMKRQKLDVRLLRHVKPDMEDVFVHLVETQRGAA
jgi:ABC-2 type transport system ATP-binding protein